MPSSIFTPLRSLFEVRITGHPFGISKKKRCDCGWDQTLKRSSAMDSEFGVSSKVTRELLPTIAGPFLSPRSVLGVFLVVPFGKGRNPTNVFYLASTNVGNLRLWRSWAIFFYVYAISPLIVTFLLQLLYFFLKGPVSYRCWPTLSWGIHKTSKRVKTFGNNMSFTKLSEPTVSTIESLKNSKQLQFICFSFHFACNMIMYHCIINHNLHNMLPLLIVFFIMSPSSLLICVHFVVFTQANWDWCKFTQIVWVSWSEKCQPAFFCESQAASSKCEKSCIFSL